MSKPIGTFKKATKEQAKLRLSLIGPSGSGKTFSALAIATGLGGKIALVDTENHSASKYSGIFAFDTLALVEFDPQNYIDAIELAEDNGYNTLIIDSLSHAWMGKGGILDIKDAADRRNPNGGYFNWRDVTPIHNALVDKMVNCKIHLIVTMRAKTEYVIDKDEKGKNTPRKVGMAPIQRDGLEYEFDVVADMDLNNTLVVSKTRCPELTGKIYHHPGKNMADVLLTWLTDGAPATPIQDPAYVEYYHKLAEEAKSAGVETIAAIQPEWDNDTIKRQGTDLRAAIVERKTQLKQAGKAPASPVGAPENPNPYSHANS